MNYMEVITPETKIQMFDLGNEKGIELESVNIPNFSENQLEEIIITTGETTKTFIISDTSETNLYPSEALDAFNRANALYTGLQIVIRDEIIESERYETVEFINLIPRQLFLRRLLTSYSSFSIISDICFFKRPSFV